MTTNYHVCISVSGVLKQSHREFTKNFKGMVKDDTGRVLSIAEIREEFEQAQAKGWKVLPLADCDNFDHQNGCKGHPEEPKTK